MKTIVAAMMMITAHVCLVQCQTDSPTNDPLSPEACVNQRISQSGALQQCLQSLSSIQQNVVRLRIKCLVLLIKRYFDLYMYNYIRNTIIYIIIAILSLIQCCIQWI